MGRNSASASQTANGPAWRRFALINGVLCWPYARLSEGRPRSPDIALGAAQRYVAEAKAARLDLLAAFDLARHRHPPMRDDAPVGRETEWRRWLI